MYKAELFDLICEAFKESGEKGVFKGITADFFMHVQESDNSISDKRKASLSKILSAEQIEEYLKFHGQWCM